MEAGGAGDPLATGNVGRGGRGTPVPFAGAAVEAGWVLPTAGLKETPSFTALTLLDSASNGLPLATTLTPRCGLGVDRLSCLPCALSEEDARGVVEDDPRARDEGVVNGLTVVDPCEPVELCELLAMAKLLELMVDDPR